MTGRMNSLCAKPELLHHSQGIKRKIIECDFILRKNKMLERTFREKWRNHTKAIYFRKKKKKKTEGTTKSTQQTYKTTNNIREWNFHLCDQRSKNVKKTVIW